MKRNCLFLINLGLLLLSGQMQIVASAKDAKFNAPLCPPVQASKQPAPTTVKPVQLAPVDAAKSKSSTAIEQAEKVNLVPLALIPSEGEIDNYREVSLDLEKKEILALWTATINRSPDIQFVINIVQPSTDKKHTASTATKYLGGALFDGLQVAPMFSPLGQTPFGNMGAGIGTAAMKSLFSKVHASKEHVANLSQQELF